MRRLKTLGVIIASGLLAAACGTSSSSSSGGGGNASGPSGVLTLSNEGGSLWTCNFNPYNLSEHRLSTRAGLRAASVRQHPAEREGTTPWLATSWKYSNGNKTLTFSIRNGVKWSDGKPMTAADVVFSFNLLKKFKALDVNAVWSVLSSVKQQGSDKVVMTFKAPAVTYFYYIADQIGIVPQHIWSTVTEPGEVPRYAPGGHRRVHGEPLHAAEHLLQGQPALLAAR